MERKKLPTLVDSDIVTVKKSTTSTFYSKNAKVLTVAAALSMVAMTSCSDDKNADRSDPNYADGRKWTDGTDVGPAPYYYDLGGDTDRTTSSDGYKSDAD